MYNAQNQYVPYKKRTKRWLNDHRMSMRYWSGRLFYLSGSWPFTTQVERTLTDTCRIPTGCWTHENQTKCTKNGQTAYQWMSNVYPPCVFIRWRLFKVLNMSRTCQRIGQDKTDITWHGMYSTHGERYVTHANGHERTENFTVRYASVSTIQ